MKQPLNVTRQYLGETIFSALTHPVYRNFKPIDWAMRYIETYGQIDGDHHKAWVLDQVARILRDTPVILSVVWWSDGHEEVRFTLDEPSKIYLEWRQGMMGERDPVTGEYEYSYDEGTPP